MKIIKTFFGIAPALLVLFQTSCSKEDSSQEVIPQGYVKAVFKAIEGSQSDEETRSTLDGKTIKWETADYLAAYCFTDATTDPVTGAKLTKQGTDVTSTADFTGVVPADATVAYVTYPFYCNTASNDTESTLDCTPSSKTIITCIPGAQTLEANSIDGACNLAACQATIEDEGGVKVLSGEMRNLVAYIKFTIDGTKNITQVLVETRNNARIAGMTEIKFNSEGNPSATGLESHYVMGYAGRGNSGNTVIPAGTYYLCAAPADLTTDGKEGLKVTVSASDGKVYEYTTPGFEMKRNKIYNLGTLEQQCVENTNLLSVAFDCTVLGTSKKTNRQTYTLGSYTGAYVQFYNNSSKGYLQAQTGGFLTTPVISGKHLSKVNLVLRAHTSNFAPTFCLRNDSGTADLGTSFATGEYRPVNTTKPENANGTLKLFRQTVHVPNYFHQLVVGKKGDYERGKTIDANTEPYQLVNKSSTSTDATTSIVDRIEFIYEND